MIRVSLGWIGFDPVTICPFPARTTMANPVSGPAVPLRKTLGAAGWMVRLKLSLTPAGVRSTMAPLPSTLNGSCAFTCVGDTSSMGRATPFTVRQDSPSAVGSGTSRVAAFTRLKLAP